MSREQNEALIRRWFDEVWNQRREEAIDEMMADDVNAKGLPPEPIGSREAFKQFHRAFLAAFPDLSVSVEEVISEGDRLAYRSRLRATHRNGRVCECDGGGFVRIRNGMLTEGYNIWNFHELLEQLQAVPANSVMKAIQTGGPAA
jgi:predicted ester cyclase